MQMPRGKLTSAYTNSFSVLYIFEVDKKVSNAMKKADITAAIQKILAVQSGLMAYDSAATELDHEYNETLRQGF